MKTKGNKLLFKFSNGYNPRDNLIKLKKNLSLVF
jgi:hypothetical protein